MMFKTTLSTKYKNGTEKWHITDGTLNATILELFPKRPRQNLGTEGVHSRPY